MKDRFKDAIFEGALFEGVLLGAAAMQTCGRGSAFGTAYDFNIPVYDPLNPANVMTTPSALLSEENRPSP